MCDHFGAGKPPQYFTDHLGQLSLLSSAEWEMSTSYSAVMLCGCGGWLILHVDKCVGGR